MSDPQTQAEKRQAFNDALKRLILEHGRDRDLDPIYVIDELMLAANSMLDATRQSMTQFAESVDLRWLRPN